MLITGNTSSMNDSFLAIFDARKVSSAIVSILCIHYLEGLHPYLDGLALCTKTIHHKTENGIGFLHFILGFCIFNLYQSFDWFLLPQRELFRRGFPLGIIVQPLSCCWCYFLWNPNRRITNIVFIGSDQKNSFQI